MALTSATLAAIAYGMRGHMFIQPPVCGRVSINLDNTISCTSATGTMMNIKLKAKIAKRNSQTCTAMRPKCWVLK
jgi:hypothetical protein